MENTSKIELPGKPVLDPCEVRRLLHQAHNGDDRARERLVNSNLRLVMSIARRFSGRGDLEDLFQAGCIGLVKAIDQFDLSYDVRFSTYAVPLIIGEIRRFLQTDGPVKVSRSLRERASACIKAKDELQQQLGRPPTPLEIGEVVGASREEVVEALDAVAPPTSIQEIIHEGEGSPILVEEQLGHEAETEGWLENYALKQACARLVPRERAIVVLRFLQEKTQAEVAEVLGISQGQVSRLEKRVLQALRDYLTD